MPTDLHSVLSRSYLYLGTANPSTTPSTVGNSYSQATGTQRTSETPVVRPPSSSPAFTLASYILPAMQVMICRLTAYHTFRFTVQLRLQDQCSHGHLPKHGRLDPSPLSLHPKQCVILWRRHGSFHSAIPCPDDSYQLRVRAVDVTFITTIMTITLFTFSNTSVYPMTPLDYTSGLFPLT